MMIKFIDYLILNELINLPENWLNKLSYNVTLKIVILFFLVLGRMKFFYFCWNIWFKIRFINFFSSYCIYLVRASLFLYYSSFTFQSTL